MLGAKWLHENPWVYHLFCVPFFKSGSLAGTEGV